MRQIGISMHDNFYAEIHHFCQQANEAQKLIKFRHVFVPPSQYKPFAKQQIQAEKACEKAFLLKTKHGLSIDDIMILLIDGNLYDHEDDEYFFVTNLAYPEIANSFPGIGILSLYYLNEDSAFMTEGKSGWDKFTKLQKREISSNSVFMLILGIVASLLTDVDKHSLRGCIMDYCQIPSEISESLRHGFRFCEKCESILDSFPEGSAIREITRQLTPFYTPSDRTIFLSYTWSDAESVLAVDQWLRNKGLITRIDDRDFYSGNLIEDEIIRIMEQCSVIVIFYSKSSKDRPYPKMERQLASIYRGKRKIKVIYFCLDDTEFPNEFESAHLAVKAQGKNFECTCQQLLRGILNLSKPPQEIDLNKYEQKAPWD